MATDGKILDAALGYVRHGLEVVPLKARDKRPIWDEWQNRTLSDEESVRSTWEPQPELNLGVQMGWRSLIVDFECDDAEAEQTLLDLFDGELPICPTFESSRGVHRLFRYSSDLPKKATHKIGGLDIKIGANGKGSQSVFPPSVHPSGKVYAWRPGCSLDDIDPPEIPDSVLAKLANNPTNEKLTSDYGTTEHGEVLSALYALPVDWVDDYDRWRTVGMALHSFDAGLCSAWDGWSRQSAKYTPEGVDSCAEKWKTFNGNGGVTVNTIFKAARDNGWRPPVKVGSNGQAGSNGLASASKQFPLTDIGNAQRFVAIHGAELRYCHPWRKWLVWDGARWCPDDTGEVQRRAKAVIMAMYADVPKLPDEQQKSFAQFIATSSKRERISAMIALAESEPGIPVLPKDLDCDSMLLNCLNGTLDLRTGELRPHNPADMLTKLCPTNYNPDAGSYAWDRFLESVFDGDDELIGFVRRLFGYCLTGEVSEHVLPIFWGGGSNGKTTLVNACSDSMGEDYAGTIETSLLVSKRHESHPTERADLFKMRLMVAAEFNERRLNEHLMKNLTGGDKVKARRMREDFWSFDPTHKIIIFTNSKPEIRGTDDGVWRRIRLVPFVVKFWKPENGESGKLELRVDRDMPKKLKKEREGVLAWMVRGCLEWRQSGLGNAGKVREATESYKGESDLIGQWLTDRCLIDLDTIDDDSGELWAQETAKNLRGDLRGWCELNGEETPSAKRLSMELQKRGLAPPEHKKNGNTYLGIRLK